MPEQEPKWYPIRLRILDYPLVQLWTIPAVGAFIMVSLLILALVYRQLRRPEILGVFAPVSGLWMAATGAAIYKTTRKRSATDPSVPIQPSSRTSGFLQFVATGVFLVVLFLFLLYLESRGYTTTQIANGFAVVGAIILGFCVLVVFFYAARNRGRR